MAYRYCYSPSKEGAADSVTLRIWLCYHLTYLPLQAGTSYRYLGIPSHQNHTIELTKQSNTSRLTTTTMLAVATLNEALWNNVIALPRVPQSGMHTLVIFSFMVADMVVEILLELVWVCAGLGCCLCHE